MTEPTPPLHPTNLDALLDQQRAESGRFDLQRLAEERPELAEELRIQLTIDESLRQRFAIPPLPILKLPEDPRPNDGDGDYQGDSGGSSGGNRPPDRRPGPQRLPATDRGAANWLRERFESLPWFGWGVALVLVVGVGWLGASWLSGDNASREFAPRPLTEIFAEQQAAGWPIQSPQASDNGFLREIYFRQGVAIAVQKLPAGVRLLGTTPLAGISRHSTALIGEAQSQPLLVLVDKRARDGHVPKPTPDAGLFQHRRELGDLVLYEVSPFDEPLLLPFLLQVEPPDDCRAELGNLPANP